MATYSYKGKTFKTKEEARAVSRADKSKGGVSNNMGALGSEERTEKLLARGRTMLADKGVTIPVSSVKQTPAMIPEKTRPETVGFDFSTTPQLQEAGFDIKDGLFSFTQPKLETDTIDASIERQNQGMAQRIQSMLGLQAEQPSYEKEYGKLEKKAGITDFQKQVGSYTQQLNEIKAQATAQSLALEGQGRGQTTSFLGGEQARIQREAAIAALPVQAQLDAAQGNLEMAQTRLNTLFQIRMKDLDNAYSFKEKLVNSVFDYADKQEQTRLSLLLNQEKEKREDARTNMSLIQSWVEKAIKTGQTNLVPKFTSLNPKSETFLQELGRLQAEVVVPRSVAKRDTGFDKSGNLIDLQTGEVIKPSLQVTMQDNLQNYLNNNADPVSTKSALSTLLSDSGIAPATKARISPALAVLNSVDELANMNLEGKFTGIGVAGRSKEWIKGLFNVKDPEATTNEQHIDAINLKVQQWASGASLTEQQTEQVNKFTPTTGDSDRQVRTKLNGLYNFMLNQTETELLTEGVNVQFPTINLFEIYDLYNDASPEQKKIIEDTYFKKK